MLPVSDQFKAAVRGSHRILVRAVLVDSLGPIVAEPTGVELEVIGGSVVLDGDADIRGTLTLTIAGAGWVIPDDPADAVGSVLPFGAEVWVARGVVFGNGNSEVAALGYYVITAAERDSVDGSITITGQDRMVRIKRKKLGLPRQYASSSTFSATAGDLIGTAFPADYTAWYSFNGDGGTAAIGRSLISTDELFDTLTQLATARGNVMYYDHLGILRFRDPADGTAASVFDVDAGPDGVAVALPQSVGMDGFYNEVFVLGDAGDGTTAPPYGYAAITDGSLLDVDSPIGPVSLIYSSPILVDNIGAQKAAVTLLAKQQGLPYTVDLTMVPNPALEPGDVCRVVFPAPGRVGGQTEENHLIVAVSIDLSPGGAMSAHTRVQGIGR